MSRRAGAGRSWAAAGWLSTWLLSSACVDECLRHTDCGPGGQCGGGVCVYHDGSDAAVSDLATEDDGGNGPTASREDLDGAALAAPTSSE